MTQTTNEGRRRTKAECADLIDAEIAALKPGVGARVRALCEEGGLDWKVYDPILRAAQSEARKPMEVAQDAPARPSDARPPDSGLVLKRPPLGAPTYDPFAATVEPKRKPEPEPEPEPESVPESEPDEPGDEEVREAAKVEEPKSVQAPAESHRLVVPDQTGWAAIRRPSGISELQRTTYVPGRIGRFVEWTLLGARRPNRMMALGVAVPLLGTVIGRWVIGPTGSATHDFVVILGPSGFGKGHPMGCGTSLLVHMKPELNARTLLGDRDFASATGYIKSVIKRPDQISFLDEFADLMSKINAQEGNVAVSNIEGKLKEAWNPWTWMGTGERSEVSADSVDWPCPSFVGACTPRRYFASLKPGDLETGFANRILILPFEGIRLPPEVDVPIVADIPPQELVAEFEALLAMKRAEQDMMNVAVGGLPARKPVGWASSSAKDVYFQLSRKMDRLQDGDPLRFEMCRRTTEHAVRWATNVAVGDNRWAVDQDDMAWAVGIAERSLDAACGGVEKYMRTYLDGPELCDKILEKLGLQTKTHPPFWRSEVNLERDFGRSTKWLGQLKGAIDQLRREERITRANGRDGERGPEAKGWKLLNVSK